MAFLEEQANKTLSDYYRKLSKEKYDPKTRSGMPDWGHVAVYYRLTPAEIDKHAKELAPHWKSISRWQRLTPDIMTKYRAFINWDVAFECQRVPLEIIEQNAATEKHWKTICRRQSHLTEAFIEKHLDKVSHAWHCICQRVGMSEAFILKHWDKIIPAYIAKYQFVSWEFRTKYLSGYPVSYIPHEISQWLEYPESYYRFKLPQWVITDIAEKNKKSWQKPKYNTHFHLSEVVNGKTPYGKSAYHVTGMLRPHPDKWDAFIKKTRSEYGLIDWFDTSRDPKMEEPKPNGTTI